MASFFHANKSVPLPMEFINKYMISANATYVKVYLYGLYACNLDEELTLDKFAQNINLPVEEVRNCFKFWEEFGVLNFLSEEPFAVRYLPIETKKPKKFSPEKYTGFNKALQVLIPDRMITTNEYSAYFSIME